MKQLSVLGLLFLVMACNSVDSPSSAKLPSPTGPRALHQEFVIRDPASPDGVSNEWTFIASPIPGAPANFLFSQMRDGDDYWRSVKAFSSTSAGFSALPAFGRIGISYQAPDYDDGVSTYLAMLDENGSTNYHVDSANTYRIYQSSAQGSFQLLKSWEIVRNSTDGSRCDGYTKSHSLFYWNSSFNSSQEQIALNERCYPNFSIEDFERENLLILNRHTGEKIDSYTNLGLYSWLSPTSLAAQNAYDPNTPSNDAFGIYMVDLTTHTKKIIHTATQTEWLLKAKNLPVFTVLSGLQILNFDTSGNPTTSIPLTGLPCADYQVKGQVDLSDDGRYLAISELTCDPKDLTGSNFLIDAQSGKVLWTSVGATEHARQFMTSQNIWIFNEQSEVAEVGNTSKEDMYTPRVLDASTLVMSTPSIQCEIPEETSIVVQFALPAEDGKILLKYSCHEMAYLEESQWFGEFRFTP